MLFIFCFQEAGVCYKSFKVVLINRFPDFLKVSTILNGFFADLLILSIQ